MAGMRLGTLYSENSDLIEALVQLGCFHGIPGPTQYQVSQLLKDQGTIQSVTVIYAKSFNCLDFYQCLELLHC